MDIGARVSQFNVPQLMFTDIIEAHRSNKQKRKKIF